MPDAPIPHFPVVHGNVYPDGTAHINFAGHDVSLTPVNLDDARAQITSYAVAVARDVLHRPVRLTTVDPDGHWTLAAHPDGRVTDLAPDPRPAKRTRRRRAVSAAPTSAPTSDRPTGDRSSSDGRTVPFRIGHLPERPAPPTPSVPMPAWTVSDLPSEAELTVFIERHQQAGPTKPVLLLAFSSGTVVRVTGPAVVGRRPVNDTGLELEVHQVDDNSRSLSRTHFAVAWSDNVPAVIDHRSGNGTTIERRGVHIDAAAGVAMPLQDGDRLRFGDLTCQVTLTVESEVTPR